MTLGDWLFKLCDSQSPSKTIIAFNFGLFENEIGYSIYLIGSSEFDKNDSELALKEDFKPKDKYFQLPIEYYENMSWQQLLNKIKFELKIFSESVKFKNSFFSKARAITTGFDDGELVRIVYVQ